MNDQPFLWSVRVQTRLIPKWEAWVAHNGRVINSTVDWAWTEERARHKALRRWRRMQRNQDIPGTRKGAPVG